MNLLKCRKLVLLSVGMILAGCTTMSDLKQPAQDFVDNANALYQAESDYWDEIQAASDAGYRMEATDFYVNKLGTFPDYVARSAKRTDFSKARQLRMAAMQQLKNYADQVAAISTASSATWISDDAKATTTKAEALLKDAGAASDAKLLTSNAGAIQAAVQDLGMAIVDHESAGELHALAQQAAQPLSGIRTMVQDDNQAIEGNKFTDSLKLDQTQAARNVLHAIYDDPKVDTFERYEAAKDLANFTPSLVTKGQAIAKALDKLEAANRELAADRKASFADTVKQAYAMAEDAAKTPATAGGTKP